MAKLSLSAQDQCLPLGGLLIAIYKLILKDKFPFLFDYILEIESANQIGDLIRKAKQRGQFRGGGRCSSTLFGFINS